jgi:hypothetical protein
MSELTRFSWQAWLESKIEHCCRPRALSDLRTARWTFLRQSRLNTFHRF